MSSPVVPSHAANIDYDRPRNVRAVGYVRVSTDNQLKGVGPDRQTEAINAYAGKAGVEVLTIISESHTATDATPLHEREGFAEALDWAKRFNCPILVETMDRVSRNERVFDEWRALSSIRIIPVCEQDIFDTAGERARVASASVMAKERAAKQAAAYDRKRAEGKPLGNPNPSPLANQRSVARRRTFAAQRLRKIVAVLDEMGPDTSRPDLARELNRRGIITSNGLEWTPKLLLRQHKEALAVVVEARAKKAAEAEAALAQREADLEEMRKHPNFGMF